MARIQRRGFLALTALDAMITTPRAMSDLLVQIAAR